MEIKDLPEREKHLKVIIRALSFDRSYMSSFEDKVKTSSIISDLCRVIIFFYRLITIQILLQSLLIKIKMSF